MLLSLFTYVQIKTQEGICLRGNGNSLQDSCLENSMNWCSLVGYSPKGCKESDMTEVT